MPDERTQPVGVYTLPSVRNDPESAASDALLDVSALDAPLLRNSIEWFCKLRWIVVAILTLAGLAGNSAVLMEVAGLPQCGGWLFACALILAAANPMFLRHARRLGEPQPAVSVRRNLWLQIVLDLLVLTAVVHYVGSVTTFMAFAYLFHIVLACIFFSAKWSLVVTLLANALFTLCVIAGRSGWIALSPLFPDPSGAHRGKLFFDVASAMLIWATIWYLTSRLTAALRQRNVELADVNRRLVAAHEERTRHMLVTTHQLKSPFAAIQAQTYLLLDGYCGPLNEQAVATIERIGARCQRLTHEIQEILQLANLGSQSQSVANERHINLARIIRWCLDELEPMRQKKELRFALDVQKVEVPGNDDHFKMLLINLLSNAATYSYRGGAVRIRLAPAPHGGASVVIADEGIGIAPAKLPRIFEEHYRTSEALKHNPESSGLGLAIVKQVALLHGIVVRVESRQNVGTVFDLLFPGPDRPHDESMKGTAHGIRIDR